MTCRYNCENCGNREDCSEFDSQAVRDISKRCGLCCHSHFEGIFREPIFT